MTPAARPLFVVALVTALCFVRTTGAVELGCGEACSACPTGPACTSGRPKRPCCWTSTGPKNKDGFCTDSRDDENNCGACGKVCAAGETCCDGVCKAVRTDPLNCGACGTVCSPALPTPQFCGAGTCTSCAVPQCTGYAAGYACTCTACTPGFKVELGGCASCNEPLCTSFGAGECNCVECTTGFKPVDGDCAPCTKPQCTSYGPGSCQCTACSAGFKPVGGDCVPCDKPQCTTYGPGSCQCTACAAGFKPVDGDCVPCDKPQCTTYGPGSCQCTACDPPTEYKVVDGSCVKCSDIPADVLFLADTTGSMGSILGAVKTGTASILSQLSMSISDIRFGVADYKDVPQQGSAYIFKLAADLESTTSAVTAAINAWSASGGGDEPEAQLYALWKLSDSALNPAKFRPSASKVVVWFGDAPGHNPICGGYTDVAADITLDAVAARLAAANIKVVAISVGANRLNLGVNAKLGGCADVPPDPQATKITIATSGKLYSGVQVADIVQVIIDSVKDTACSAPAGRSLLEDGELLGQGTTPAVN